VAFANIEQAEFWSQLAPTWLELEDQVEKVGGLPGQLAMDRLNLLPGQRVVDLGCGAGRTTLELASRVGRDGEVVGIDIAAEMLARGGERAARLGTGNIEFLHADVQAHDLGEGRFDAALKNPARCLSPTPTGSAPCLTRPDSIPSRSHPTPIRS
jgi:SAM-dependent methyltransferase